MQNDFEFTLSSTSLHDKNPKKKKKTKKTLNTIRTTCDKSVAKIIWKRGKGEQEYLL